MFRIYNTSALCCFLIGLLGLTGQGATAVDALHSDKFIRPEKIKASFKEGQDATEVIINLVDSSQMPVRWNSSAYRQKRRAEIHASQQQVLSSLSGRDFGLRHCFENQAGFSAYVTRAGLQELSSHPRVKSIEPVIMLQPHLAQGINLMNAFSVRQTCNGQGIAIAICDTGIDYTHPALGGGGFPNSKVIGGYDFGDNDSNPLPNTQAHGTCCAGIAAGDVAVVGDYIGGVAYNAKLYALKITAGTGDSASNADMVAAWDWCVTHQYDDTANPIMVISTSFGGGQYFSNCDNASPSMAQAANNAAAAGITVLASSGNEGYCDAISWPACIGSVISVGAVYDASFGTYYPCITAESCAPKTFSTECSTNYYATDSTVADKVASYSNTASFLGLLAPSNLAYTTDISDADGYSTGNYYGSFGGTSAACPYAAGAVACLQSAAKQILGDYLLPSEIRDILTSTGDNITDTKVSITKPRINLDNAINSILIGVPPIAYDVIISTLSGDSAAITLSAADEGLPNPPGDITYTITSLPNHGTLTEPNGWVINSVPYTIANFGKQVVYIPRPGCDAPATFTFIANDGGEAPDGGDSNQATVTVQFLAVGTIYLASMDTNPGWTLDGSSWAWGTPTGGGGANGNPDPTSGFTGANVVGYNLSGDYGRIRSTTEWAKTPAINCTGRTSVTLKFYRWLNVDSSSLSDHASIEVSNNGYTWSSIWQNTARITDAGWTLQMLDISAIADNQPTIYIRWGMGKTNSTAHYSGWNIDDVEVTGLAPISPTLLAGDFEPDCDVDLDDLSVLIGYWLQTCGDCHGADLLTDGIVNFEDFAVFAQNWLTQQ